MLNLFQKGLAPEIRRIGVGDADACAALHASAFTFAWPQDDLEVLLLAPTTFAAGAFGKGDELLGFVLSRLAADEAEILTIAVKPKRRGQGVAGRLLQANMEALQRSGARSWFLEVEAQNSAALALYKRFGFEQWASASPIIAKPMRCGDGLHPAARPGMSASSGSATCGRDRGSGVRSSGAPDEGYGRGRRRKWAQVRRAFSFTRGSGRRESRGQSPTCCRSRHPLRSSRRRPAC